LHIANGQNDRNSSSSSSSSQPSGNGTREDDDHSDSKETKKLMLLLMTPAFRRRLIQQTRKKKFKTKTTQDTIKAKGDKDLTPIKSALQKSARVTPPKLHGKTWQQRGREVGTSGGRGAGEAR
jgi:hypothetical protein